MNREYHKGYSSELHREMEAAGLRTRGHALAGVPHIQGRFFEYEDRGMIGVLAPKIDAGELQVFCPDAVDSESWYNKGVHPRVRVLRHLQYERYILHEMLPFLRWKNNAPAAGGHRLQLRRLSCDEFFAQASRRGDLLREHERSIRYPSIPGWILR